MYKISKELFEAVIGAKCYQYNPTKTNLINWSIDVGKRLYGGVIQEYYQTTYNDFFFKCIDFVNRKGYIFNFDSRGFLRIKHISTGDFKMWEDEEFNKQRLFDACQWILEKENKQEVVYKRMENYAKHGKEALLDFDELMKNRDV